MDVDDPVVARHGVDDAGNGNRGRIGGQDRVRGRGLFHLGEYLLLELLLFRHHLKSQIDALERLGQRVVVGYPAVCRGGLALVVPKVHIGIGLRGGLGGGKTSGFTSNILTV